MSYDLYFLAEPVPEQDEFAAHFEKRPHYTLDESGSQALYANEDTGVYFTFDLSELSAEEDDSDPEDPASSSWASFNLNYYRLHYFADEAVPELEAFVSRFGGRVFDPQFGGMGEGEFSPEGFRRGWDHGNQSAYGILATRADAGPLITRPAAELTRIWRWNLGRERLQQQLGESIFVPRISFFQVSGRSDGVVSASVWTDAIPVVLPETDMVVIHRGELAARGFLRKRPAIALAPWEAVRPHLEGRRAERDPIRHHFLDHARPPGEIVRWFKRLPEASIEPLQMDKVLDAEILTKAMEAR